MKTVIQTIATCILLLFASNSKAQDYGTLKYWGKDIKLDRSLFEILNSNYNSFMNSTAPSWKYYDFKDYQDIYIKDVDNFKSSQFTIIVTEANQLQWSNAVGVLPGTSDEKGRSKKSSARAGWVLYQVVLPSLQTFAKFK